MGGCRCSYKNCPNSTKTTENIHFFHYPVKQKERCKMWIDNAKKPQFLDLEEEQLRNKVICEMHFEDKWFPNIQRKRLLQGAIPTLDGDSTEEKTSGLDFDSYLISDVPNDLQVLPVSEDGSCFILDTDFLVSKSAKVESFVYKNGSIVPSSQVTDVNYFGPKCNDPGNRTHSNNVTLNSNSSQDRGYQEEVMDEGPDIIKSIKSEVIEDIESNTSTDYPEFSSKQAEVRGGIEKRKIGRSYLRKIKEHSREIATIKKMLKEKVTETKSDYKTIMDSLREQLPPTLLSVVNLHLDSKCDLSGDDVEFFTTFYKTSPEAYALLMERYSWNMPCVQQSE